MTIVKTSKAAKLKTASLKTAKLGAAMLGLLWVHYPLPAQAEEAVWRPPSTVPVVMPVEDEPDFELLEKEPDAKKPGGAGPQDKAPPDEESADPPGFGGCIYKPRTLELLV